MPYTLGTKGSKGLICTPAYSFKAPKRGLAVYNMVEQVKLPDTAIVAVPRRGAKENTAPTTTTAPTCTKKPVPRPEVRQPAGDF
jgi:hypothetical protein